MFQVPISSDGCYYSLRKKEPDCFSFQPRFDDIDLNGEKSRRSLLFNANQ